MGNRATLKVDFFSNIYKKNQPKQLNKLVISYKLAMFFVPVDRKSNKSNFGREKHEKTFNCFGIYHTKTAEYAILFNENGKETYNSSCLEC